VTPNTSTQAIPTGHSGSVAQASTQRWNVGWQVGCAVPEGDAGQSLSSVHGTVQKV
jgi:hypothetical protein